MPQWPYNFIFLIAIILYLFLLYGFRKIPFIGWLSSTQASIGAITVYTILVICMGLIPQNSESPNLFLKIFGLNHISTSWPFLTTSVYFLVVLGLATIRRIATRPMTIKNLAFLLNHAGLWFVLALASLGSGDLQRLTMQISEGDITYKAVDKWNKVISLPFALELKDFRIDEYHPKLLILNKDGEEIADTKGDILRADSKEGQLGHYIITIDTFIADATWKNDEYEPDTIMGASPAALVNVTLPNGIDVVSDWVSCGSFSMRPKRVKLDRERYLYMITPTASEFSSDVRIYRSKEDFFDAVVEVNKPVKIKGYKIYQTGYDERFGKWSKVSIFELVRDPWIPAVYVAIFMLLIGATYLFWRGSQSEQL